MLSKLDSQIEYSQITHVTNLLGEAFASLGVDVPAQELERISVFLNKSYGTKNRAFHNIKHALDVSLASGPLCLLAGLFHDVVYLQVDPLDQEDLRKMLNPFELTHDLKVTLPKPHPSNLSHWQQALYDIFDHSPGDIIDLQHGLNELLSAWIAILFLHKHLSAAELLQVMSCIEATIPFRGHRKNPSAIECLGFKIQRAVQTLKIKIEEDSLQTILIEATKISNHDVKGFAEKRSEKFIHNSWALLYEANPSLQSRYFTIKEYREPLRKIHKFLSELNPTQIFSSYLGLPSPREMQKLEMRAENNLATGRAYFKAKLMDLAVLESFAEISGGDCPLELFLGRRPRSYESNSSQLETTLARHISDPSSEKKFAPNEKLMRLLKMRRAFRFRQDIRVTLLGSFLNQQLDPQTYTMISNQLESFFDQKLSAQEFLSMFPDHVLSALGSSIGDLAPHRQESLREYFIRKKAA